MFMAWSPHSTVLLLIFCYLNMVRLGYSRKVSAFRLKAEVSVVVNRLGVVGEKMSLMRLAISQPV